MSMNNNNINGPIPPDEPNLSHLLPAGNDNFDHLLFPDLSNDIWPQPGPQQFNDFTALPLPQTHPQQQPLHQHQHQHQPPESGLPTPPSTTTASTHQTRHQCFHAPNEVLANLTIQNPDYGDAASGRRARNELTLPQVLHANKAAIASFHRFLECGCSRRIPELVLLQASLVSRVLFFYREAAGVNGREETDQAYHDNVDDDATPSSTSTPSSSSSTSSPSSASVDSASPAHPQSQIPEAEPSTTTTPKPLNTKDAPYPPPRQICFTISDPPFQIGSFDITHPAIQAAFRNQLIASEVHKLRPIVAGFAALAGRRTSTDDGEGGGGGGGIVSQVREGIEGTASKAREGREGTGTGGGESGGAQWADCVHGVGAVHAALYGSLATWLEAEYERTVELFRGRGCRVL